jgi:sporulation protein YlmC with PRC-barrel domain
MMNKKTLIASFAAMAIATSAYAQNNQPVAENTPAVTATGSMDYIAQQKNGEWLTSRLIGTVVENSAGENLGDINDVIVSENGEVVGAVIGVGGFLGMGEKNVAVPYGKISTTVKGDNQTIVVLNVTREELQAAPDYSDLKGQPLSVTKRLRDSASETYKNAKDKASETYKQAKERVSGDDNDADEVKTQ